MSKERLIEGCGEMILQDVEDKLIDDPPLNLVPTDKTNVFLSGTVKAYNHALVFVAESSVKLHHIIPIEPLGKMLTGDSGLSPLCEQVDTSAKVDIHCFFASCNLGNILVECTIAVNGDGHERSPAIVLALS